MNRLEAVETVVENLSGDELIVHANGAVSRESYACRDRKENFYLLGSMGLCASVALGIAVNRPERKVVALDGDGNVLMGLGNLALAGAIKPDNFIHLVLDNQAYGTTGNQPTISSLVALDQVAGAAGYRTAYSIALKEELIEVLTLCKKEPGPHFVQVLVSREICRQCPRIPYSAEEIKERFIGVF